MNDLLNLETTSDCLWASSNQKYTPYTTALEIMQNHIQNMINNQELPLVWLLEHDHLYTAGTSAKDKDLISNKIPVHYTNRGGQMTYHGPGQRIMYAVMNLHNYQKDVKLYVHNLEQVIINTLKHFGVNGERRQDRIGIWVDNNGKEEKIAAIGIRVTKWHTMHGFALNVNPDLSYFGGIVPCGLSQYGVCSLHSLGIDCTMDDVDQAIKQEFSKIFFE